MAVLQHQPPTLLPGVMLSHTALPSLYGIPPSVQPRPCHCQLLLRTTVGPATPNPPPTKDPLKLAVLVASTTSLNHDGIPPAYCAAVSAVTSACSDCHWQCFGSCYRYVFLELRWRRMQSDASSSILSLQAGYLLGMTSVVCVLCESCLWKKREACQQKILRAYVAGWLL